MIDFTNIKIQLREPQVREYRLMYLFGAWVTSSKIYAESDIEAVGDADDLMRGKTRKLQYALFEGNRLVKRYEKY